MRLGGCNAKEMFDDAPSPSSIDGLRLKLERKDDMKKWLLPKLRDRARWQKDRMRPNCAPLTVIVTVVGCQKKQRIGC